MLLLYVTVSMILHDLFIICYGFENISIFPLIYARVLRIVVAGGLVLGWW